MHLHVRRAKLRLWRVSGERVDGEVQVGFMIEGDFTFCRIVVGQLLAICSTLVILVVVMCNTDRVQVRR